MRGSSLRNDRFFSQQGRPETTPEEVAAFREHLEEAYRRAEALLERHPDDVEALYYLGATEALESGWAVIVDRAWFRAARTIRRGVRRHRRVQELDPDFKDAYAVRSAGAYATSPSLIVPAARTKRGDDSTRSGPILPPASAARPPAQWNRPLPLGEFRLGALWSHWPGHRDVLGPQLALLSGWRWAF